PSPMPFRARRMVAPAWIDLPAPLQEGIGRVSEIATEQRAMPRELRLVGRIAQQRVLLPRIVGQIEELLVILLAIPGTGPIARVFVTTGAQHPPRLDGVAPFGFPLGDHIRT